MILRADGRTHCGAVVDLRDADVDDRAVVAAIRGEESRYGAHCSPPTVVHERAGYVHADAGLATRTALAAAGRSRGLATPYDDDLAAVRDELATFDDETGRARQSTAPDEDRERLRERVAELRGRVQALETVDRDPSDARARLRDAARRLSEMETERVAAAETRERMRERRDRRERRMCLQDREANLQRDARAHLVDTLRNEFAAAVDSLPPTGNNHAGADPFETDPVTASLAVLAVADVRAPVVVAVDRFERPAAAAGWLDAPVVRL